jgi:hypothetical protein
MTVETPNRLGALHCRCGSPLHEAGPYLDFPFTVLACPHHLQGQWGHDAVPIQVSASSCFQPPTTTEEVLSCAE